MGVPREKQIDAVPREKQIVQFEVITDTRMLLQALSGKKMYSILFLCTIFYRYGK